VQAGTGSGRKIKIGNTLCACTGNFEAGDELSLVAQGTNWHRGPYSSRTIRRGMAGEINLRPDGLGGDDWERDLGAGHVSDEKEGGRGTLAGTKLNRKWEKGARRREQTIKKGGWIEYFGM